MENLSTEELEQILKQKKKEKRKIKFSKFIVTLVILLNTTFAAATLYVFLKVGSEPQVLIGAWFAFTTGELWMLSGIKKKKIKEDGNEY